MNNNARILLRVAHSHLLGLQAIMEDAGAEILGPYKDFRRAGSVGVPIDILPDGDREAVQALAEGQVQLRALQQSLEKARVHGSSSGY